MVIRVFNIVFWLLILLIILLIVGLYFILKNKSEKIKIIVLSAISVFNIIFFFVYKVWLSKDAEFLEISNLEKFNWWSELPLHLCNISMFMIPIALIFKLDSLKSYVFFISTLGAFMAMCFPERAFTDSNIFLLRNIGFYGTHIIICVLGISVVTLGLYKPTLKGIHKPVLTALFLASIMFVVNTILRNTVSPEANYFYTYQTDILLLSTFWEWLSIPLLYEVFTILILIPYCLLILGIYKIFTKKGKMFNEEN